MPMLTISRSNEHTNRVRNIKLLLNNKEIGTIANGTVKEFTIEPGRHSLMAKIDWGSSKPVVFEVAAHDTIAFELMSFAKGKYPNGFSALYHVIFKPGQYLILRQAGK